MCKNIKAALTAALMILLILSGCADTNIPGDPDDFYDFSEEPAVPAWAWINIAEITEIQTETQTEPEPDYIIEPAVGDGVLDIPQTPVNSVDTPFQKGAYKIVLIDYGAKESIKQKLLNKNCDVFIAPYNITAEEIKKINPNGIVLSDGPGDPDAPENSEIINNLKEILKLNLPVFGICLGHQLLALANGFKTNKLKYGHRGANQPVKDLLTGRVYITNQNHGYEVLTESINKNIAKAAFINVNDKTCEGIDYINKPVFSVQFHPDDCMSPHGTGFLYERFIKYMDIEKDTEKRTEENN